MNDAFPWLILFLPLAAAAIITLFTQRRQGVSAALSVAAILASFFMALVMFSGFDIHIPAPYEFSRTWLEAGDLKILFGLRFDALSLLMLLIVTGVGSAIHIYSIGYMHGDRSYSRF